MKQIQKLAITSDTKEVQSLLRRLFDVWVDLKHSSIACQLLKNSIAANSAWKTINSYYSIYASKW